MKQGYERRRFPRVNIAVPLRCKNLYGEVFADKDGISKNISKNGVRFECEGSLPVNSRLLIEINLPRAPKPISIISRVVWVKKIPAEKRYEFGNKFISIRREDAVAISDFAKETLLRQPPTE